jgi:hypothetical protein
MARKKDDAEQSKRFIETARKLEVDENPEAFERAFKKVVPPKRIKTSAPSE